MLVRHTVAVLFVAVTFGSAPATAAVVRESGAPTVGSTITTRRAAVTLHAFRDVVKTGGATETAPPGTAVTAIDVEICNRSRAALPVRRGQFFIEMPDGKLLFPTATSAAPRPQLTTTRLPRHRCARGWLSYIVPAGTRAAFAIFQAGAMFTPTLHRWTIPQA